MKKHPSPTKRLMQQKDAAFKHKEFLSRKMKSTQDYQLCYVASPTKTYVIEPKGGEINYDLAHKDPLKFYNKVMTQDIREHSATKEPGSPLKYRNILTKRAIAKVLAAIERKLTELIKEQTEAEFASNNEQIDVEQIQEVMQTKEMEHALKQQVSSGGVKLVNAKSGSPMFVKETKLIGEKGKAAVDANVEDGYFDEDPEAEPDDAKLVSTLLLLANLTIS